MTQSHTQLDAERIAAYASGRMDEASSLELLDQARRDPDLRDRLDEYLLNLYVDDELDESLAVSLMARVSESPELQAMLAELQTLEGELAMLSGTPIQVDGDRQRAGILSAVHDRRLHRRNKQWRFLRSMSILLAIIAAGLLLINLYALLTMPADSHPQPTSQPPVQIEK
jgi:hypothetical protein